MRGRAKRPAVKDDLCAWGEITEQRNDGRAECPFGLTEFGPLLGDPEALINIAFRFPVIHSGNVRACDDCKHSTLNDFARSLPLYRYRRGAT